MSVKVTFVEAPTFSAVRDEYFGTDDVFALFQEELAKNPAAGAVISGTHGARKIRWARPGRGKRGGLRIIYGYWSNHAHVLLLAVYCKSGKENLTFVEQRIIAGVVHEYESYLRERARNEK